MKAIGPVLAALVLALVLAGCGGHKKAPTTTTTTPQTVATTPVSIYLLLHGKVQPVQRDVEVSQSAANAAFAALVSGPTPAETKRGLATAMPATASWTLKRTADGVIVLATGTLTRLALAQTVYTLTQFPTARVVDVGGTHYTRASFEAETPAVLVESPLANASVSSPVHVTGTANTFEATFHYDLLDSTGKVIKTHFVTATSGTGTRGTFSFDAAFTVDHAQPGTLLVYEVSAKDGSHIHKVEIPLRLAR